MRSMYSLSAGSASVRLRDSGWVLDQERQTLKGASLDHGKCNRRVPRVPRAKKNTSSSDFSA
jgi:hypothetical protein